MLLDDPHRASVYRIPHKRLSANRRSLCNSPICQFFLHCHSIIQLIRPLQESIQHVTAQHTINQHGNRCCLFTSLNAPSSCERHVLTLTYRFLVSSSSRSHKVHQAEVDLLFLIITTQLGHHRQRCYNNPQRFQPDAQ
jgi:hypothetical protein